MLILAVLVVAAGAAVYFITRGNEEAPKEITLMTWGGDFVPREVIDEFTKETGIIVNYKEVTSN